MSEDSRQRAFVTGASGGLGQQIAVQLAQRGWGLALTARDLTRLECTAAAAREAGARDVIVVAADLTVSTEVIRAWLAGSDGRPVQLLLNVAGFTGPPKPIEAYSAEEFDKCLALNLRAPVLLIQQAFRDMPRYGGGQIVNVLSTAAHFPVTGLAPYVAAKSGLMAVSRVAAREGMRLGIGVMNFSPGALGDSEQPGIDGARVSYATAAGAILKALDADADGVITELAIRSPLADPWR